MGTSTDAVLFYGYHLPEGVEVPEAAWEDHPTDAPVQIDNHCSDGCSMPYVYWAATKVLARRGYPEAVNPVALVTGTDVIGAAAEIRAFAKAYGLPAPGEPADPDWPEDKASDVGWWLVSWWG